VQKLCQHFQLVLFTLVTTTVCLIFIKWFVIYSYNSSDLFSRHLQVFGNELMLNSFWGFAVYSNYSDGLYVKVNWPKLYIWDQIWWH